jgi:hypothetical protein
MYKKFIFIAIFIGVAVSALLFFRQGFIRHGITSYLKNQLNADIDIEQVIPASLKDIHMHKLSVKNINGLNFTAESGSLSLDLLAFLREGVKAKFILNGMNLYYSDSQILTGILDALSLGNIDSVYLESVAGEFSHSRGQFALRSLNASGPLLSLSAYGISNNDIVDYSLTMLLSEQLTAGIPESVRRVFFHKTGTGYQVKLHIAGNADNPSISFATDLFTFTIK